MNRAAIELREVIKKLVPMLTGRGLKVTQIGSQAYVEADPKTNKPLRVNIPSIPDNATDEFLFAIQGFIDHEVSHVLHTDWAFYGGDGIKLDKFSKEGKALTMMHNIIEDTFVERKIVEVFPGSKSNLRQLHEYFIERITKKALDEVKGNENAEFSVLVVPMVRALSGQEIFEDFMTNGGHWDHPMIKNLMLALSEDTIDSIKNAQSTQETFIAAQEIHDILFKKQQENKKKQGKKGKSEDKPEKKAGEGSGTGERDHSESEGEGESGPSSDPGEKGGEDDDEADAGSGGKAGEPDKGDDEADGPGDSDSTDGEENDEDASGGDGKSDDEAEDDEEGSSDGDGDDTEGNEDEGEGDTDAGLDDAADGSASSEDDVDDAEGEDGDEGEEETRKAPAAVDPTEEELDGHGGESEADSEMAGYGGNGGKSMFDLNPDDFKPVDLSSAIGEEISKMARNVIGSSEYTVFTREYDEIKPFEIPDAKIKSNWVPDMEKEVNHMIGPMQKEIERMLASQSKVLSVAGKKNGRLHAPSLYRLRVNDDRVFSQREEHKARSTAVTLLVDNSGSMRANNRIVVAMKAAFALGQTLERVGMASEILGFTTAAMPNDVMEKYYDEISKHRLHYHRVRETIIVPIFKAFEERMNSTVKKRIAGQINLQMGLYGNIDGEAVEYAAQRLIPRREDRKVMIVLSDGQPVGDKANEHLRWTVQALNKRKIDTIGIGIQSDAVKAFYDRAVVLQNVSDLPKVVMNELRRLFTQ